MKSGVTLVAAAKSLLVVIPEMVVAAAAAAAGAAAGAASCYCYERTWLNCHRRYEWSTLCPYPLLQLRRSTRNQA